MPYPVAIIARLPPYSHAAAHLWTARVPLICFCIVEWHFPDQVMRQFGGYQLIPPNVNTEPDLHQVDLRGRVDTNWVVHHAAYHGLWNERDARVVTVHQPFGTDPEYNRWFRRITRRYISHTGATFGHLVCFVLIPSIARCINLYVNIVTSFDPCVSCRPTNSAESG